MEQGRASDRSAWARLRFALVFCVVTVLLLIPLGHSGSAPTIPHLDKLVHLGFWFVLALTLWPVLRSSRARMPRRRAVLLVGLLAAWGVATELLQSLTPDRTADPSDALADILGAVLGALLMGLIERGRPRSDGPPLMPTPRENER